MVVVSGNWGENVGKYSPLIICSDVVNADRTMAAKAILTCRPNSHPFQERTLVLDQPVKVGRSVARVKATPTNAVFDCKVLSRNHAMLWYKDGKFFLQDTKSSNGTFVNNNKLTAETENHELSSGDIVQFGVDVVESRKVTHGCIVASIKLYLPDGKEAKASPSIGDGDRQGVVPLDELYKLNQIIQEANQREQCLEMKLSELQNAVIETRKSAEESWFIYVGEERLLSHISALETQLQHTNKSWGEDKIRAELMKVQEESEAYQVAAKQALEKLHAEKLEAVALAMEKERARFAAEQEALLAKEQFAQIQLEFQLIARRLSEQQKEAEKQQQQKLEMMKEEELEKDWSADDQNANLQLQLHSLNNTLSDYDSVSSLEQEIIYNDDINRKEGLLAENEVCESLNNSNGSHICLTVGPVEETKSDNEEMLETTKTLEPKRIKFTVSKTIEDPKNNESHDSSDESKNDKNESEKDDIDSKTLRYQYQTAQNEIMKQRIDSLKSITNANKSIIAELRKNLDQEKEVSQKYQEDNSKLKEDFIELQQQWKESCNENQQYKDKISSLSKELEIRQGGGGESEGSSVSFDQLVNLEEELVVIKERFAQVSEEKLKLQRDLLHLTDQYNLVCSRSYNKYFFYVAPLVIMVLYLLVSAMIS